MQIAGQISVQINTHGDIWDAHKDMLWAGIGAILAMAIVFLINLRLNPNTWTEIRDSFRLPEGDQPLGEVKMEEMLEEERRQEDAG